MKEFPQHKGLSVLLMIADDWSPIAGCYGNTVVKTPNIDALAARGLTFNNAFCTTPSCAASRANILTGRPSHQHRQYGHSHNPHNFHTASSAQTLPQILNRAGIHSGLAGKSHIAPREAYPFTHWSEPTGAPSPLFSNKAVIEALQACQASCHTDQFYLHVASGYPHRVGGTYDRKVYQDEFDDIAYSPDALPVPDFLPDTPTVRADLAEYYTFISRFDAFVGNCLQKLDTWGQRDNTLVILMSDHGMPFPGAKASPFEQGHNCPLIISPPNNAHQGEQVNALVDWCDILPTILDYMEVPEEFHPDGLTGRSLRPLLDNPDAEWEDEVYYSHSFHEITNYFPYRSIRGKRYKYLECLAPTLPLPLGTDLFDAPSYDSIRETPTPARTHERLLTHEREAFFDLEQDPLENVNLIHNPELQETIQYYRNKLTKRRLETDDPWLEIDYQEGKLPTYRSSD